MKKKASKGSKKEAMIATQSGDYSSDCDGDVCILAIDNEVSSSSSYILYDELASIYSELCKEIVKLQKMNNAMKEMMLSIKNELDELKHEYDKLKDMNDNLSEDVKYLRYENEKFKRRK